MCGAAPWKFIRELNLQDSGINSFPSIDAAPALLRCKALLPPGTAHCSYYTRHRALLVPADHPALTTITHPARVCSSSDPIRTSHCSTTLSHSCNNTTLIVVVITISVLSEKVLNDHGCADFDRWCAVWIFHSTPWGSCTTRQVDPLALSSMR